MAELLTLPGVARKTANIVLGNAHPDAYATDPDAGIAVDTHVNRLSQRLGLATSSDSDKIERELMEIVPRADWFQLDLPADRARSRRLHGQDAPAAASACCRTSALRRSRSDARRRG